MRPTIRSGADQPPAPAGSQSRRLQRRRCGSRGCGCRAAGDRHGSRWQHPPARPCLRDRRDHAAVGHARHRRWLRHAASSERRPAAGWAARRDRPRPRLRLGGDRRGGGSCARPQQTAPDRLVGCVRPAPAVACRAPGDPGGSRPACGRRRVVQEVPGTVADYAAWVHLALLSGRRRRPTSAGSLPASGPCRRWRG